MSRTVTEDDRASRAATDAGLEASTRLMTVLVALSRASGLVRMLVALAVLGTSSALSNVYQSGNSVPTLLFELLAAGALSATLVPEFRRRRSATDPTGAARLASGVLVWGGLVVGVVVVAAVALRGPLSALLLGGLPPGAERSDAEALLQLFLLVFLPQVLAYLANAVAVAYLQAAHRFGAMVVCPLVNNVVLIVTFLVFRALRDGAPPSLGLTGAQVAVLAGGTTLGVVAMCAVPAVDAWRHGLRPVAPLPLRSPELRVVVTDGWWAAVFLASTQVVLLVALPLTNAVAGNTLVWTVAWQVFLLPFAVLAVPVITSRFPALAAAHDEHRADRFRETLVGGVRSIVATGTLAGALMWATAAPVGRLLAVGASRGAAPELTGALRSLAPAVVAFGLVHLLARTMYAVGDTRAPAAAAVVAAVVTVGGMFLLSAALPLDQRLRAIGWSLVAGQTVALVVLGRVVVRRTGVRGTTEGPPVGRTVLRRVVAAGAAGAAAWGVVLTTAGLGGAVGAAVGALAGAAVGLVAFVAVDSALGGPGPRRTLTSLGAAERLVTGA